MALEFTQRFRRQVAPYDITSSLTFEAGVNYCPSVQTVSADGSYNIDRGSVPTLVVASVAATAADKSETIASIASSAVTNIKWMVQKGSETSGRDITTNSEWSGQFVVGSGSDKGQLTITKNVPAGVTWKIWMECDIADTRRGYTVAVHVITDSVLLYSVSDAGELYAMSIDRPSGELYDLALDSQLQHEYLIGLGQAHTLVDNGSSYIRRVSVTLKKGKTKLSASDYTLKVFKVSSNGTITEVTAASDDCIASISGGVVIFDTRFSKTASYQIACFVSGTEVGHKHYGWTWSDEYPTTDDGIVGGATYADGDKQTYGVKFDYAGTLLQYPTIAYDMQWFFRKPGSSAKTYLASGESCTYDLTNSNMFSSAMTDAVLAIEKRGVFSHIATAASGGNRYVDGSGNYYIEN